LTAIEIMDIDCEVCGKRTETEKGIQINKLPPALTLSLNRFELDYETWQRKKINDKFEYPLELDMYKYTTAAAHGQELDPDTTNYELKAILIHAGNAGGGHYYTYIKDDCKEGNWDLKMPDILKDEPEMKVMGEN